MVRNAGKREGNGEAIETKGRLQDDVDILFRLESIAASNTLGPVQFQPIPEPTTVIFGTGLASLAVIRP